MCLEVLITKIGPATLLPSPYSLYYVFEGSLFQHRLIEQLNVTKIWSLNLCPIYLPVIVVIVKYRVFSE